MAIYYDIFNHLDILSIKPEIKVNSHSRYITTMGIILGFLSISTITIFTIFILIDTISRTKYTIIYNLDSLERPNLNLKDNQIALLLLDPLGNEINEYSRIFNFIVKYWKIEIPSNFTKNSNDFSTYLPKYVLKDIPLKNCSDLNINKFQEFYVRFSKVYKSGLCLDFTDFNYTLFGKYGSVEGYSTLNIYINKCINSTIENRTNCLAPDIIDKKLSQTFLSLVSIENDINSDNFLHPIEPFTKNEILPLSSTIFKNYFMELNSVKFNTDDGFFFDNFQNHFSYRTDKIIESVDLRGSNTLFPGTFSQITLRCSGKTEIFSRAYMKIAATFAYIGGIMQVITFIGKSIVYLWSKNNMISYLILNIFDHDEINQILFKNNENIFKINNEESKIKFIKSNVSKLNNLKNIMDLSAIKLKQVNFINNSRQNIRTNKFHTTQHLPIENMNKNNLFYNQNLKNKINFNNVKFNKLKLNDQKNTNNYEVYNLAKEKNNEDDSNNLHFNNNNNNLQADNSDLNDLNLNQTNTK